MNFITNSSALVKQLQKISGIVSLNNTLPILDDFLFDVHKGELTIYASDLETTMSVSHKIESKETGNICIPARLIVDILKKLPDQPVTFSVDTKTYHIEISSDYGKYKLSGHDPEEYPKIPTVEGGATLEVNSLSFAGALETTIFAAGSDDMRPAMSGILFELSNKNLTFVATDAHRLVRFRKSDSKADKSATLIIPKKPLNILKPILKEEDVPVKMQYNKSHAFFSLGNVKVICRLIDGKYPNYEAVIPSKNPNKLTIDRLAFMRSLERVSIFSNKTTYQVRLKISGNEVSISAEDLDFANEAVERLACNYAGEDLEIGFSSKFLIEMLGVLDTNEVVFEMSSPSRAGILLPGANGKYKDDELLMLVMPIMLNA